MSAPGTTHPGARSTRASSAVGGGWRSVTGYWLTVYRRIWKSTVASSLLVPLLYLAGMGYGLGAIIDSPGRTAVPGVAYVGFVATGLIAAQTMMTAVAETTYSVFGAIKWQRTYHAMLASPLQVVDLVRGHLAYLALRLLMVSTAFAVVALAIGAMTGPAALLTVPIAVLGGLAFGLPVYAYTVGTASDEGFNMLNRFVIMPLFLFSGTFFPISQLPAVLEGLAWASPLTHAITLTRAVGLGVPAPLPVAAWPAALHVAYLLVWAVAGYLFGVRRLRRRMVV
ncbi:MAG TPA: ABC transporter permease [Candidatus Ruania gallistercoris]|uniref:Transport permease protein n=1 Tax=Candidatus Ruania gallistercoris TaxID=2838746 RepID=A0A9D2EGF6_9MICO|nr:ABC transporter permease [Candidatus Ruania gallistercoris]